MSHFTVTVIGDNPEEQLAPFEEKEVDRYVKYTKEQLIEKGRKDIEDYKNGPYARYLEDPVKYAEGTRQAHLDYISIEFPKKLSFTDEEVYQDQIKSYEPEEIGENGEVYSTYNPLSKWDWYQLGGRWAGMFKLKDGAVGQEGSPSLLGIMQGQTVKEGFVDQAKKGDIDWEGMKVARREELTNHYNEIMKAYQEGGREPIQFIDGFTKDTTLEQYLEKQGDFSFGTFALLKDGKWYERGKMRWWATVTDEKDEDVWDREFTKLLESVSDDTLLSVYDCHI